MNEKRYHIPRILPEIGYKMPELTFTKLKRKQSGELEKVEEEKKQVIEDDFDEKANCTICYTLMVEPCSLHCNHVFCIQCINRMKSNVDG